MKSIARSGYLLMFTLLIAVGAGLAQDVAPSPRKTPGGNGGRVPLVTFVELGSVRCIHCKQMQAVMKAIGKKYGGQVRVIFHDVWKPEEAHQAKAFGIRLIPTQVFLDAEGKEFSRHEGFYPEEEIDRLLQEHGLKPLQEG